jgi:hypothetical protein
MKLRSLLPRKRTTARRTAPPFSSPVRSDARPEAGPEPIPLPPLLQRNLVALRRHRRRVLAATGLFLLAGAVSLLLLGQALADWWFELPWLARAVFLAADAGIIVSLYRRHGHAALRRKLTLGEVALLVEKKWPQLEQSVITAVELAEGRPRATRGSGQLVGQVLELAQTRTSTLNFREVVPLAPLRRWVLLGGAALVAAMGLAAFAWPSSLALLERIALLNVPLPTRTIVRAITGDMAVPLGSDVEVSARAEGVIPRHGRLTLTYAGGAPQEISLTVRTDQPGVFSFTVHNVQNPFTYRFDLNDGSGPDFKVAAEVPPALGSVACTQVFPAYTRLPSRPLPVGNLMLLAGSRLEIKAPATVPLREAVVIEQGVSRQVPMTLDGTGTQVQGEIPIPAKDLTGFSIHLTDRAGLISTDETVFPITIEPDLPPAVKIVQPSEPHVTVTMAARPVIVFDAVDDYGIAHLTLHYQRTAAQVTGDVTGAPDLPQSISIPVKLAAEGTRYEVPFDLTGASPPWREGDVIDYWVEATDNNDVTGPGVTTTPRAQFEIVSPAAKQAEIMDRLRQAAASLGDLSNTQEKASADVGKTIPQK